MSKNVPPPAAGAGAAAPPAEPAANWDEHVRQTLAKLHQIYLTYVKPLEDKYKYDLFRPSWFEETILNQRPFVTFFGPWSAGKSTFINHLLQDNYLWTGPQPTTAEFTVIVYGEEPGPLDGRVLVNAKDLPFKGLNEFGEGFLQNFQGFQAPHEVLKSVTLIDTPGVLESAKEIHQRKYDYIKLSRWFAERSDLIFVMFDPTKLDAGMELRMMFKHAFKGQEGKVRIVLNKSDSINTQELMRVYGSLFWNLSNMISSTEPPRVYVGSFWDQPYKPGTFHRLFAEEKTDLIHELTEVIPAQALDKKVASLIRRAKDVFVHAIIIGGMRQELPMLFGKEKAKRKALDGLPLTYEKVGGAYKMNWKDFPPVDEYRAFLEKFDLEQFPELQKVEKEGMLSAIRNCIDTILPADYRPVKHTAILDPRNKEQRKEMQDMYHASVRQQYEGKQGIQGSSDTVQSGIRASAVQPVQQPVPQQQQSAAPPVAPAAAANPQLQMMQMMMMMQQQQQQQQQQFNPALMAQMMQQMQQQQFPPQQQSGIFPPQQQQQPLSGYPQQTQPSGVFVPQQTQQSGNFYPQDQQQQQQAAAAIPVRISTTDATIGSFCSTTDSTVW
ncbi:sarcoplasmic reticulum glycoprotein, putative [Bodo saltans]|uniref:Sarcoplasmic reticulum glycoprotein, putative n=1 Tax=Bodo saltans TaxID=75058 RepID=A0A0S4KGM0_BODSA|nr:sarcoplasmic reticulum glycoprotein, putative [Bodo saltans]|eukprot:CUI14126.1 sarcoplasmic reticulum glycoprotein, putative [Bodo saltans]